MNQTMMMPDVLTLEEVASYLRLPKETVERQVLYGHFPGRKIEDSWRFLKAAVDEWLQSHDARDILLHQAGTLADDERLQELRDDIYAARGRAETEEG